MNENQPRMTDAELDAATAAYSADDLERDLALMRERERQEHFRDRITSALRRYARDRFTDADWAVARFALELVRADEPHTVDDVITAAESFYNAPRVEFDRERAKFVVALCVRAPCAVEQLIDAGYLTEADYAAHLSARIEELTGGAP